MQSALRGTSQEVNCAESAAIILVEPSLAVNVGAAARAMKNMGFSRLRLVYPASATAHLSDPARRMSAGSEEILEQAQVFPSLARF